MGISNLRLLLVVLHAQALGGLEIYSREIAFSLRRLGHDVTLISVLEPPQKYPEWGDIPVRAIAPRNSVLYRLHMRTWRKSLAGKLRRYKSQFDRVFVMHPYAAIAAHQADIKDYWVWTYGIEVWGDWPDWLAIGLQEAQRILAISSHTADAVRNTLPKQRIEILHPVIDDQRFVSAQPVRELSPPFRLLTVGRLVAEHQHKGHDLLIRNLKTIQQLVSAPVEYWIAGNGPGRSRLEALVRRHGVEDHVRFLGRVPDEQLVTTYQACNIFVMPSAREGFGIVFLEASACGKPVIGGGVGGAVDAIADGITGYCVDPHSDGAVVSAVTDLLLHPTLMHEMGRAGRLRVEQEFSRSALDNKLARLI